jgi:hypothetical protein
LALLLSFIYSPISIAQSENPACLQILEAQANFDLTKAKGDAALKVANPTTSGLGASFYKSAQAAYNQIKKEKNIARNTLKSLTQKCGKKPRK